MAKLTWQLEQILYSTTNEQRIRMSERPYFAKLIAEGNWDMRTERIQCIHDSTGPDQEGPRARISVLGLGLVVNVVVIVVATAPGLTRWGQGYG